MAGITLEIAEARLTSYLAAEEQLLTGHQEAEVDTGSGRRRFKRSDLSAVQEGIKLWEGRVQRLTRGGGVRVMQVIPL